MVDGDANIWGGVSGKIGDADKLTREWLPVVVSEGPAARGGRHVLERGRGERGDDAPGRASRRCSIIDCVNEC